MATESAPTAAAPLSLSVVNAQGQAVGTVEVDPAELGGKINKQLLHEVVLMYLANQRAGTHSTLRRGEVAGSTKKLFRQKGTGNARVGTTPHQQAPRRRHRQGPQAARLRVPSAEEGRPRRDAHGHPQQAPGPGSRHRRRAEAARDQDEADGRGAQGAQPRGHDLPDRPGRRRHRRGEDASTSRPATSAAWPLRRPRTSTPTMCSSPSGCC